MQCILFSQYPISEFFWLVFIVFGYYKQYCIYFGNMVIGKIPNCDQTYMFNEIQCIFSKFM